MKKNHLEGQKSPYLLQHLYNPVDWYPWSEEAFDLARKMDKPVFLSIGYSTCHWCHVMEKESFEDHKVAEVMNDAFVSIKVDREEMPDVDQFYMQVCQMMTGSGGWPLNIIIDHDRRPLFAFTYLPKDSRNGQLGLIDLVAQIKKLWKENRDELREQASKIINVMANYMRFKKDAINAENLMHKTFEAIAKTYDEEHGGFGFRPKFPNFNNILFLLSYGSLHPETKSIEMARKTLLMIRGGGIYDQIGYGIHRYSTDPEWVVPHFEKMLYDQAMAIWAYSRGYYITKDQRFRLITDEIFRFAEDSLKDLDGGFYSAMDADSSSGEGAYYLWNYEDLEKLLGDNTSEFTAYFNCHTGGNYLDEATGRETGANILYIGANILESTEESDPFSQSTVIGRCIQKLRDARTLREQPRIDRKIVAETNALFGIGLVNAFMATGDHKYLNAARSLGDFLISRFIENDGTVSHEIIRGVISGMGILNDYSYLTRMLLELYSATGEHRYFEYATKVNSKMIEKFYDTDGGFFTSDRPDIPVRMKDPYDAPNPSGNSIAIWNLVILSYLQHEPDLLSYAVRSLEVLGGMLSQSPGYFTIAVMDAYSAYGKQIFLGVPYTSRFSEEFTEIYRKGVPPFVFTYPVRDGNGNDRYVSCTMNECFSTSDSIEVELKAIKERLRGSQK
ncbi:MAG: thioredoxin domain-containing protein [Candidatus Thermoplasmatota archaeon]|nr:thioredoxin domain-containing protein [Candidatus Thermoplasmatota archaeon]